MASGKDCSSVIARLPFYEMSLYLYIYYGTLSGLGVSLREVSPRGRHLGVALVAECEVALLLIVLDATSLVHRLAIS